MQLHQYIRITKKIADECDDPELANLLDERVADAILCLPRRERVRIVMKEED